MHQFHNFWLNPFCYWWLDQVQYASSVRILDNLSGLNCGGIDLFLLNSKWFDDKEDFYILHETKVSTLVVDTPLDVPSKNHSTNIYPVHVIFPGMQGRVALLSYTGCVCKYSLHSVNHREMGIFCHPAGSTNHTILILFSQS